MEIEAILLRLIQEDVADGARRAPAEAPGCPALPRFREGLLDPRRWSEAERRHLFEEGCPRCQRTLQKFRAEVWHPGTASLARHALSSGASDASLRQHLEADTCRRCLALVGFLRLSLTAARSAWEELERFAEGLRLPFEGFALPNPAAGGVSAQSRTAAPIALGDDFVMAIETAGVGANERLVLRAESSDARLAGKSLRFVLLGEDGEVRQSGRLRLADTPKGDAAVAKCDLGPRGDLDEWRLPVIYPDE